MKTALEANLQARDSGTVDSGSVPLIPDTNHRLDGAHPSKASQARVELEINKKERHLAQQNSNTKHHKRMSKKICWEGG